LYEEVSFEDTGKALGVSATDFGTYTSAVRPNGSICGEGQGGMITQDGEIIAWTGSGLGRFKEKGAVGYRGIIYFQTTSQKLARLNSVGGVFKYEVDPEGKTHTKVWGWE
jgi:hypothetical protein